jgi:hypothetical protein
MAPFKKRPLFETTSPGYTTTYSLYPTEFISQVD